MLRRLAVLLCLFAPEPLAAQEARRPGQLGVEQLPDEVQRELGLPAGAAVGVVSRHSPAERAGLQPGDVIVAIDGQAVADFLGLAAAVQGKTVGDELKLDFQRGQEKRSGVAKLARRAENRSEQNLRAALAFLPNAEAAGPATLLARARLRDQLAERAGALAELGDALKGNRFADRSDLAARRLELLFLNGKYEEFLAVAKPAAERFPNDPRLLRAAAQAALAGGQHAEAESFARQAIAAAKADPAAWANEAGRSIRIALDSRMRRGLPFVAADAPDLLDGSFRSGEIETLTSWRDALAGAAPYELASPPDAAADLEFKSARALFGFIPNAMRGIEISIDGHVMPLAIVDTGAAHTLVSQSFAKTAGLQLVGPKVAASGSMGFTAQSALIKELKIGPVTLRNVPVNVGDPPPLVMTQAKAALGVDVMQHLRFEIDYGNSRVRVRPARYAPEPADPEAWDIPLYAFAEHALVEARLPNGASARTIIDSGNFAATLVWPRWGQEHIAGHAKPAGDMMAFVRSKPVTEVKGMALGGKALPNWPGLDMPPMTLEGVDLLDLLMGHDLLSQYVVTVDMQGRRLRLRSPGGKFVPPKAPDPALLKMLDR